MSATKYWNLLILFCVLCQGIIGTLSEKDIDESSGILYRQKRVINRTPGEDLKEHMKNVPYVVSVKAYRIPESCVGVILTNLIVLTVANCVVLDITRYRIHSGTARTILNGRYVAHTVTDKRTFYGNHPHRPTDGVALITVDPAFVYSLNTHNIGFYEGNIAPGLYATISGWGCNAHGEPETAHPTHLRSITVPIINNEQCATLYHHQFPISESDICTLDPTGNRFCGVGDAGAPLVIKTGPRGNHELLGVHLFNGGIIGQHNPDIFINLQRPDYKRWILDTIRSIEAAHYSI